MHLCGQSSGLFGLGCLDVHHAVALHPLTAAHLTLDRIAEMTDELLHAHAALLPESLRPADAVTAAPVADREARPALV